MVIKVQLDTRGTDIVGWWVYPLIENDPRPIIEIEKEHDFFTNFLSYKYIDGQLVKGEPPETPVIKTEIDTLKEENAILKQQMIQQNIDMQEFMDFVLPTLPQ